MQPRRAGQNVTQAVQNGFDRGLIRKGAGRIQQSSVSIFGAPHDVCAPLPSALIRRPYHTLNCVHVVSYYKALPEYLPEFYEYLLSYPNAGPQTSRTHSTGPV